MSGLKDARRDPIRHAAVLLHRYVGLALAGFLILIGLTGSVIVFNPELGQWLDPPPAVEGGGRSALDPLELRARAQSLYPTAAFNIVTARVNPSQGYLLPATPRMNPVTGQPYALGFDMLYVDPYTATELRRDSSVGLWPITRHNLLPLINRLHYSLAVPGSWGVWLFGIVALLWTVDCFVSVYLTFPPRRVRSDRLVMQPPRTWVARWWRPSWLVKWRGSAFRVNFDLHRAGGLWLWLMLAVFAWSGVGFNLSDGVYTPVMRSLFGMPDIYGNAIENLDHEHVDPQVDWTPIRDIARKELARQAAALHFTVTGEEGFFYDPAKALFTVVVHTNRDVVGEGGGTVLLLNDQGKVLGFSLPTGQNAGATMNTWLFALHTAAVWGLPFRLFVALLGIAVSGFSVTGIYIWWRKRAARTHRATASERTSMDILGKQP